MRVQPDDRPLSESAIRSVCGEVELPRLGLLEQVIDTQPIAGPAVDAAVGTAIDALALQRVPEGGRIALAVGSRGIGQIARIVAATVGRLSQRGFEPVIIPAMGSHGGATAEGQESLLAGLGITEDAMGCPIMATMATVDVPHAGSEGEATAVDAVAAAADAVVCINRVKPHTSFSGPLESGLAKMLVVGLGNQQGATEFHQQTQRGDFTRHLRETARTLLASLPVIGGIAILEDQYDATAQITGVGPDQLLEREQRLLARAYELLPQLPFDALDVLVVDQMGKDISGTGMDPNVVGRHPTLHAGAGMGPDIGRIFTRQLSVGTHGNAAGVGLADVIHEDVRAAMDPAETTVNMLTSGNLEYARIPITVPTDRAGIAACIATAGGRPPTAVRLCRVTNTSRLERLYASPALCAEAARREDLRVLRAPRPMRFDAGQLTDPPPDAAGAGHR
jgi:hypothetical protein